LWWRKIEPGSYKKGRKACQVKSIDHVYVADRDIFEIFHFCLDSENCSLYQMVYVQADAAVFATNPEERIPCDRKPT
jgi:hypothetical protein